MDIAMRTHAPNVDDLTLTIHAAVLAEDGWDRVIRDLSRLFGARGAALVRPSRHANIKPSASLFEFDAAAVKQYEEYWGEQDVWYRGAARHGRIGVGIVNLSDQLVECREFEGSDFYNEYLRPMDIHRMMNICLAEPSGAYGPTAMSFYRGNRKEAFSAHETELLSRLAPDLTVATQNFWAAQSLRMLSNAYRSAIDAVTSAVFGIDATGHVVFVNQAAEDFAREARWVQILNGSLRPAKALVEGNALARAVHQLSMGLSFRHVVTNGQTLAQAIVSGARLSRSTPAPFPIATAALVWVTPIVPDTNVAAELAKLFELTPAEQRLVARLITGDELREAALHLHISLHTARTQLKSVYRKSGRRTQAALLTFAARLAVLRTSPP
jgi:DNA-binding CsgD family transcriptional regulator/PAS domain-containing protein